MLLEDSIEFFYSDGRNRCKCKSCGNHLTWCYTQDAQNLFFCYQCGAKLTDRLDGYKAFTEEEALHNISRKVIEVYRDKEMYFSIIDHKIIISGFHYGTLDWFFKYYIFADTKKPCGIKIVKEE